MVNEDKDWWMEKTIYSQREGIWSSFPIYNLYVAASILLLQLNISSSHLFPTHQHTQYNTHSQIPYNVIYYVYTCYHLLGLFLFSLFTVVYFYSTFMFQYRFISNSEIKNHSLLWVHVLQIQVHWLKVETHSQKKGRKMRE